MRTIIPCVKEAHRPAAKTSHTAYCSTCFLNLIENMLRISSALYFGIL